MKRRSTTVNVREMQIRTIVSYYCTPVRAAITKKEDLSFPPIVVLGLMATPRARGQRSSPDWPVTSWVVWGILSPLWPPFPLCDVRRSNGMILKNPPSRTTRLMRGFWQSILLTLSAHYESAQLLEGSSLKERPDGWDLTVRAPAERRPWLASGRQQDAWSQVAHSLVNH